MHQSGHTRAGPAPQGQPGCELNVWNYQVVVATVMFSGLSRGCYTLGWLAVWVAACCGCIGVGDAGIMWVSPGSGLVSCHQEVARPLCTSGRWRLLGPVKCQGQMGCPKLGWNSSCVVALYWPGSHVITQCACARLLVVYSGVWVMACPMVAGAMGHWTSHCSGACWQLWCEGGLLARVQPNGVQAMGHNLGTEG